MADTLYTKKEYAQWRGPATSDNYNERIENLYRDLVHLYNKIGLTEEAAKVLAQRFYKDHFALMQTLEDLEGRVLSLEDAQRKITFRTDSQLDNGRFDGTVYEINEVDSLFHDAAHGVVTLPKVPSSSASKVHFINSNGEAVLPSTFEAIVRGDQDSLDSQGALIDSNDPYGAFLPQSDVVWERNVVVDAPDSDGAIVDVYVRLPIDLLANANSNTIIIHPFPMMGCELIGVAASTQADITLSEDDNYVPINSGGIYSGQTAAVGWTPPGGWSGDEINDSGPKAFYFDPMGLTAVKITLRQRSYMVESGKYVYSYGLSHFDVRYDKFLDSGKAIFRFDAPEGETISSIDNVVPQIWNVSESELPYTFSYRVLWETSAGSGSYTVDQPVGLSNSVWIEVTLNKTLGNGTPALSGLVVSYS